MIVEIFKEYEFSFREWIQLFYYHDFLKTIFKHDYIDASNERKKAILLKHAFNE